MFLPFVSLEHLLQTEMPQTLKLLLITHRWLFSDPRIKLQPFITACKILHDRPRPPLMLPPSLWMPGHRLPFHSSNTPRFSLPGSLAFALLPPNYQHRITLKYHPLGPFPTTHPKHTHSPFILSHGTLFSQLPTFTTQAVSHKNAQLLKESETCHNKAGIPTQSHRLVVSPLLGQESSAGPPGGSPPFGYAPSQTRLPCLCCASPVRGVHSPVQPSTQPGPGT